MPGIDALPVERFIRRSGGVYQLRVCDEGGEFVFGDEPAPAVLANAVAEIERDLGGRLPDGYVSEASGENIFVVRDGVVYTPELTSCLEGITRRTTLELAAEIGLPAREEKVHADQLLAADEAFITSTAGGIMPVNSVDGIVFGGSDGPGELTARLHNLYWEKRWDGWLGTPVHYAGGGARATHTIRP